MNHHAKAPSAGSTQATGNSRGLFRRAFATRAPSGDAEGSRAPSSRRLRTTLAALALMIAAFALTAAPALAAPPTLGTPVVSDVSYASAHVTGEVTNDGSEGTTFYEFQYSSDEGATWSPGQSGIVAASPSSQTFPAELQGLKGATHYNVRLSVNTHCVFSCAGPLYYSPEAEFTTLSVDPPVILGPVAASEVKYTTAKASGEIERPANPDPAFDANCRFEYVTDAKFDATGYAEAAPAVPCGIDSLTTPNQKKHVEVPLENLAPATEYHLRLTATNAGPDASLEAASTFTTLTVDPPSVKSIDNAAAVEYTQAQVKGVVERPANADPAFDVECYFEFVTDDQFTTNEGNGAPGFTGATPVACEPNPVTAADTDPGVTKAVEATLTGLAPSTTYHLRLAVSNKGGSDAKEAAATFTTAGPIPAPSVLSIDNATDITDKGAQVKGEVQRPAGKDPILDINCRFEFITDKQFNDNPPGEEFAGAGQAGCAENPITAGTVGGDGKQVVKADLAGQLIPERTYHLRLVAENGAGGTDIQVAAATFTTLPADNPIVTIDPVAGGTFTTAHVSGTVTLANGHTFAPRPFVQFSTDGGATWTRYDGSMTWTGPNGGHNIGTLLDGEGLYVVEGDIAGLQPSTTYLFRIIASYNGQIEADYQSVEANGEMAFSPEPNPSITTEPPSEPATAKDLAVTDITANSAHFSATVDPNAPAGPLSPLAKKAYETKWHFECSPECKNANGNEIGGTVQGEEGAQPVAGDAKRLDASTEYEVSLVVSNAGGGETVVETFKTPLVKPTIKTSLGGSDGKGGYTLQATVNPNGSNLSDCKFEWGPNSSHYDFSAPCSPALAEGRAEVQVIDVAAVDGQFQLTYRGQTTADIPFDASAAEVQAALEALSKIGPGSVAVTGGGGRWTVTFQGSLGQVNAPQIAAKGGTVPLVGGSNFPASASVKTTVGGGNALPATVEAHLTGLNPGVVYHFNLLATNAAGTAESGDKEFTATLDSPETCPNAQLREENNSLALPECRAYEMVTPPGKEGFNAGLSFPALSGFGGANAISYASGAANLAKSGQNGLNSLYVATRSETGWETIPNLNGASGSIRDAPSFVDNGDLGLSAYSPDLRSSIWRGHRKGDPGELNYYLRSPEGTFALIGSAKSPGDEIIIDLSAVSDDLSHFIVEPRFTGSSNDNPTQWGPGVYEFVGTGVDVPRRVDLDNSDAAVSDCPVFVAQNGKPANALANAMSADGSTIVFTVNGGCGGANPAAQEVWARVNATTSFDVSASQCNRIPADPGGLCNAPSRATFAGAAKDGSRVFFMTTQQLVDGDTDQTNDLYACDIPTGTPAPIGDANSCASLKEVSGASAGAEVDPPSYAGNVLLSNPGVVNVSEDGSTIYFLAKGVLADNEDAFGEEAVAGDHNLYAWRTDAAHPDGQTIFVGRLDSNDIDSAQSTPDGRYLVFATASQLVDTDTDTARDVYRYDADAEEMTRASTNVFGVAGNGDGFDATVSTSPVSDDGQKIVFTTAETLSPADGNGEADVYLWTPARVSLISTGAVGGGVKAIAESILAAINGSGHDIYFQTPGALTPADGDDLVDVYDARIGGGFSFAPKPVCTGESCQSPTSPPPPMPASPANRPNGEGNVKPKTCPKGKVLKGKKCVKKPHKKHPGKKRPGKKAGHKQGGGK